MKHVFSLSSLKINRNSRVLVFMPHPDDEAVFISGLLKKITSQKISLRVIVVTSGEKSTLRFGLKPQDDLALVRKGEQKKSFSVLGVDNYEIYNFPDGQLNRHSTELTKLVFDEIHKFKPTLVITLEPSGIYGHPDHIALSRAVTVAVDSPRKLLYATINAPTFRFTNDLHCLLPKYCLHLNILYIITKIRSLRCHYSQFGKKNPDRQGPNFFNDSRLLFREYYTFR